jgi:uncharacterized membrane protein YhfC
MDSFSMMVLFVVSLLAIIIPLYLVKWYKDKHKLPLKVALFGAGFYILVQIIHIPLVLFTQDLIYSPESLGEFGAVVGLALYLGLLAALFEEPARYLIFSKIMKEKNLENAKLFGLGWGGVEAIILVGLLAPVSILLTEQFFNTMDEIDFEQTLIDSGVSAEEAASQSAILAEQKAAFGQRNPLLPIASLYERILAMGFHICASILIMASIMRKEWGGFIAAFVAHFLIDFAAVVLLFAGGIIAAEIGITVIVGATILYTARYLGVSVPELAK